MGTTAAPARVVAKPVAASSAERAAAGRLGAIYLELARRRATPLGPWAIAPEKARNSVIHGPFTAVLGMVYGTDTERARKPGVYQSRFELYKKDYDTVVPKLLASVYSYTTLALNSEVIALTTLWKKLIGDHALADSLHTACKEIMRQRTSREFNAELDKDIGKEQAARLAAASPWGGFLDTGHDPKYLKPSDVQRLVRSRVAKAVRYAGIEELSILFEHPEGMAIVEAYAKGAGDGRVEAIVRVQKAIDTVEAFALKAMYDGKALRYPFFIVGGVAQRKLEDVPGFTEFALSLGQLMARDAREAVLGFAAVALGCLALVFSGPAAPALLVAILAAGDLAFAGMGLGLTFMREREQDLGSQSSAFRPQSSQFATPAVYQDTALAGAATLLSAIAFFKAAKELRAVMNVRPGVAGRVASESAAMSDSARVTTAPENKAIQGRGVDGARGTTEPLTAKNVAKPPPPDEQFITATSKEDQARAMAKDVQKQRADGISKKLTAEEPRQPKRAADKPEVTSVEKASESNARATRATQKALPPEPLPQQTPDRLAGAGDWTKKGKLNVNEGSQKLTNMPKETKKVLPKSFEQGYNQQLAEPLAEKLSNKPVRKDIPGTPGYGSPSTGKTNRLKLQRTRQGDILKRTPEGTMEVVENVPGGGSHVTEVHFFEATMQSDFKAGVGFQGHKQRQISGTTWLSTEIPRKGYGPNTKLYYHILCPEPPGPNSIEFLNSVMDEVPNLEINWFVVQ